MLLAEKLSLLTDLENSFKLQLQRVKAEKKELAKKQAKIEKLYALQLELTTDPDTADSLGGGCQIHPLQPIVIEICDADEAIALPSIATEVIEQPTTEMTSDPDEAIAQTTETTPEVQQTATELPVSESQETEQTASAPEAIAEPEITTEQPDVDTVTETEATVTQPIESEVAPQENEQPTEKTEDAIAEVVPDADTTVEALETEPTPTTTQVTVNPELEAMSIRQLKALAAAAKIKNYGKMSKQQLIEALS